jgi:hypothetical protein
MGNETHRIAVVNMDWDRIKAVDLFALFSSFKPEEGTIKSVKIFTSEFGKNRLRQETNLGPPSEIFRTTIIDRDETKTEEKDDENEDSMGSCKSEFGDGDGDGDGFDRNKLRKYQLERLR